MKKVVALVVLTLGLAVQVNAQDKMMKDKMMSDDVQKIALEQTPGEFTQKTVTVSEGTYVFEIANNGVDHNICSYWLKRARM